mmetsp:Transcript_32795/g.76959  ORF Transcript_32795/g.76959 Transcript_32795/m.76959 type:complete len:460 (+) Transcript_32795:28-1407(+)
MTRPTHRPLENENQCRLWAGGGMIVTIGVVVGFFFLFTYEPSKDRNELDDYKETVCQVEEITKWEVDEALSSRGHNFCFVTLLVDLWVPSLGRTTTASVKAMCEEKDGCSEDEVEAEIDCREHFRVSSNHTCWHDPDDPTKVRMDFYEHTLVSSILFSSLGLLVLIIVMCGFTRYKPSPDQRILTSFVLWIVVLCCLLLVGTGFAILLANRRLWNSGLCEDQRVLLVVSLVFVCLEVVILLLDFPPQGVFYSLFKVDEEEEMRPTQGCIDYLAGFSGGRGGIVLLFYAALFVAHGFNAFLSCVKTQCDYSAGGGMDACGTQLSGLFVGVVCIVYSRVQKTLRQKPVEERPSRLDLSEVIPALNASQASSVPGSLRLNGTPAPVAAGGVFGQSPGVAAGQSPGVMMGQSPGMFGQTPMMLSAESPAQISAMQAPAQIRGSPDEWEPRLLFGSGHYAGAVV